MDDDEILYEKALKHRRDPYSVERERERLDYLSRQAERMRKILEDEQEKLRYSINFDTAESDAKRARERARQAQLQGAALALIIAISTIPVFLRNYGLILPDISSVRLVVYIAVPILALAAILVYFYLSGWVTKVSPTKKKLQDSRFESLNSRIEKLEINSTSNQDINSPLNSSTPTVNDVANAILPEIEGELVRIFEEQYERRSAENQAAAANARRFSAAVSRLEREIKNQGRKGSVNLAIGLFTTGLAITLLIAMVFQAKGPFNSVPQIVSHYVPWLSVTIFIEVFSFFFLRLYKATLLEARRYNDDLTRLTLQWVATDTGRFSVEPTAIASLAKDLIDVTKSGKTESRDSNDPSIDTNKTLKALLDVLSKQLEIKAKKSNKPESSSTESD